MSGTEPVGVPPGQEDEEGSWQAFLRTEFQRNAAPAGLADPQQWRAFLRAELQAPVTKSSGSDAWTSFLTDLTAEVGPDVVAVMIAGIEALRSDFSEAALVDALESGLSVLADTVIPWHSLASALGEGAADVPSLRLSLERVAAEAGEQIARELEAELGNLLSRDSLYERAARWARTRAGALITGITENSRAAVRTVLATAFEEGRSQDATRRAVREILGLDTRRALALDRYIQHLVDDPDLSAAQIQFRIDQRFKKLRNQRAETVARTELWTAGNMGQLEAWKEAATEGVLDIQGLNKFFISDLGEIALAPTLHPKCYCTVRLVRVEAATGWSVYVREWVVAPRNPCPRCIAFKGKRAA